MKRNLLPFFISFLLMMPACSKKSKKELWVYTSMYKDMIELMKDDVQKEFPEVRIQWFASGSEKVSAKINAELEAKNLQADILMTSDPFFYIELKNKGLLTPYESPNSKNVPPALKDSEHYFATQRVPVVVMAYNRNVLKPHEIPKTFKELTEEKWKGKVMMGSPLESGTTFTAVAALNAKYGWDFFKKLRANNAVSSGGNSTVRAKSFLAIVSTRVRIWLQPLKPNPSTAIKPNSLNIFIIFLVFQNYWNFICSRSCIRIC